MLIYHVEQTLSIVEVSDKILQFRVVSVRARKALALLDQRPLSVN